MAIEAAMKYAIKRVARALQEFAQSEGFPPDGYRILFHVDPEWGRIQVIFALKARPEKPTTDLWFRAKDYLDRHLRDEPEIAQSYNLRVEHDVPENLFLKYSSHLFQNAEELVSAG
jgi:hypothetical protein